MTKLQRLANLGVVTIIVSLLAVMVTACGAPATGSIVDKRYEAPYSWTEHHNIKDDKGRVVGSYPVYHHVDARYQLRLRNDAGDEGWRTVPPVTWNAKKIGEMYP